MENNKTDELMNTLVTQSFGKENEYRRAIFAIWSYWTFLPQGKVLLFTDAPAFFKSFFQDRPIEYISLTPQKIKEMRGEIDFLHRMKIALIEEAFQLTDTNLFYIDSDTFFIDNPTSLLNQVSEKKSFMHLNEYQFDSLRKMKLPAGETFHAFLKLISNFTFENTNGSTINVSPLQYSWNAGVMMLHCSHAKFLTDVYALTDQFYPPTQNHASEQYAFSIVLQNNTTVEACDSVVYHYWYRVKKQIIDIFLNEKINKQWGNITSDEKMILVRKWTKILPSYLENHLLTLRDNAIQSFHENKYKKGYKYSLLTLLKNPFDLKFIKDILYHTHRLLLK